MGRAKNKLNGRSPLTTQASSELWRGHRRSAIDGHEDRVCQPEGLTYVLRKTRQLSDHRDFI